MKLKEGQPIENIAFTATSELSTDLAAYRGKKVVIYFYPKDNTPGCTAESIDFSARLAEFQALGVQIIGVSKDSLKSHANFKTKKELTVILASDEHADACEQFGV